jgi:hypothetical protein
MKIVALVMLGFGLVGCVLALLDSAGPIEWNALGHSITITLQADMRTALVSAPLLIGGIVLWFYAARREHSKRELP